MDRRSELLNETGRTYGLPRSSESEAGWYLIPLQAMVSGILPSSKADAMQAHALAIWELAELVSW